MNPALVAVLTALAYGVALGVTIFLEWALLKRGGGDHRGGDHDGG